MMGYAAGADEHSFFDVFDSGSDVLYVCITCNGHHTFKSHYFARQWANQHATGRRETLVGLIWSGTRRPDPKCLV